VAVVQYTFTQNST